VTRGRLARMVAVGALVAALAAVGGSLWAWRELNRPYAGWSGSSAEVVVEPGLDAGSVLQRLFQAGVVRRPGLARAWLALEGRADRLRAGEYRFDAPASCLEVLDRIARGDVLLHAVTLPEGLTLVAIAARLEQAGFGPRAEQVAVFRDPSPILDLDPQALDLEGYLYPDTYHFPRGTSPERIAAALVGRFREVLGGSFLDEAERSGLGLRGAVILASMIERETAVAAERARISRVFHNRLAQGMRLECDPTVIYAIERSGGSVTRLTYADLRFESEWNTYVVAGLPQGPIGSPGRESLLAAVRPEPGQDLYFVAAPGGGHRFSSDFSAHLRAVAEWRSYVRSSR